MSNSTTADPVAAASRREALEEVRARVASLRPEGRDARRPSVPPSSPAAPRCGTPPTT